MMKQRICGDSQIALSALGLGCWEFGGGDYWGPSDQSETDQIVKTALESGINYFDTAEVYNEGRSERALGLALRPFRRRDYAIGSKISPSHCHVGEITRHCEASLKRLQTDYLDIYMLHWPINPVSLRHFTGQNGETADLPEMAAVTDEFARLQKAGKIRSFGVSNFRSERLAGLGLKPTVNELPYNLLCRAVEYGCLEECQKLNIGVISYMALLQGVLGKTLASLDELPEQLRRTRHFDSRKNPQARHGGNGFETTLNSTLVALHEAARQNHAMLPELAIRWAAANPQICCVLVGSRNPARLAANAKAAETPLSAELKELLDRLTDALKNEMGSGFDYYESIANDRT